MATVTNLPVTFRPVASGIDADRAARPNQTPVVVIPPVVSQSDAIAGDLNGESSAEDHPEAKNNRADATERLRQISVDSDRENGSLLTESEAKRIWQAALNELNDVTADYAMLAESVASFWAKSTGRPISPSV